MSSDEFAKPVRDGSKFDNPLSFKNWKGLPGFSSILRWRFCETNQENVPSDTQILDKTIPVTNLTSFVSQNKSSLFASWLGHATVLVEMEGARFITDPIWAARASFTSFLGPARYRPPPMKIEDLPELHFAVISHDHYDHLDLESVKYINRANPGIRWFVPLGMKEWMSSVDIQNDETNRERVTELNWGESVDFKVKDKNYTVWCLPAQHWGQRGPFDRNERLWSGWAIIGENKRFYYTGDTGFCEDEFRKIGNRLGPFDLAAIPIGAYAPRSFMKSQHINPDEAVEIHKLIKSKMSIGIHWGTYHMGSYEYYLEPKQRLQEVMEANSGLNPFETIQMGKIWEEQ
ncbi:unnamed protein product [Auanema sp. JU1783]|nr:unnamed protein product [Auanema sp. JU1783]